MSKKSILIDAELHKRLSETAKMKKLKIGGVVESFITKLLPLLEQSGMYGIDALPVVDKSRKALSSFDNVYLSQKERKDLLKMVGKEGAKKVCQALSTRKDLTNDMSQDRDYHMLLELIVAEEDDSKWRFNDEA